MYMLKKMIEKWYGGNYVGENIFKAAYYTP